MAHVAVNSAHALPQGTPAAGKLICFVQTAAALLTSGAAALERCVIRSCSAPTVTVTSPRLDTLTLAVLPRATVAPAATFLPFTVTAGARGRACWECVGEEHVAGATGVVAQSPRIGSAGAACTGAQQQTNNPPPFSAPFPQPRSPVRLKDAPLLGASTTPTAFLPTAQLTLRASSALAVAVAGLGAKRADRDVPAASLNSSWGPVAAEERFLPSKPTYATGLRREHMCAGSGSHVWLET